MLGTVSVTHDLKVRHTSEPIIVGMGKRPTGWELWTTVYFHYYLTQFNANLDSMQRQAGAQDCGTNSTLLSS